MTALWRPEIAEDPEAFVMFNYPWGKENTPLHDQKGPRTWQRDELKKIAQHVKDNKLRIAQKQPPRVYQSVTASGRGVGKSALLSWLTDWQQSCHLGATTIITANTEDQLKSKTLAELGRWRTLAINSHWFDKQMLSMKPSPWFQELLEDKLKISTDYYYASGQTWSEENTSTYAGAHNPLGMMVLFDEASGIHENIWTVTQGFFTERSPWRFWLAFSNPRRNTGAFKNCFYGPTRDEWHRRSLDGRSIEENDPAVYEQIIKQYGEDSDEARVEVKGEFPRQGDKQFISSELVEGARDRETISDENAPIIMGVDPARFGDDKSVIRFRQGRNARIIAPVKFKGLDNMELANQCASLIEKYNPDAIAIDAGNGTGVIDRLREMGYKVSEVWFGAKSEGKEYANKRTELWGKLRAWLPGGCIDNDKDLIADLPGPEYGFMGRSDLIMLESKEKMKARGIHSPDDGDALAVTFAVNPARRDIRSFRGQNRRSKQCKDVDYSMFGD